MDTTFWFTNLIEWVGVIAVTIIVSISARFKRRPVIFTQKKREGIASLLIFLAITGLAFFLYPAIEPNGELEIQRLVVGAAGLVMVVSVLLVRKQPILSVGWGKGNLKFGLWLGLALVIITIVLRNRVTEIFSGLTTLDGASFLVWLLLAFVEETVFRGYVQLRLENWLGERWGWIATAAAFMLYQIPRLVATSSLAAWPQDLMFTLLQGLVLGFIMKRCGSTLAPMLYRAITGWL